MRVDLFISQSERGKFANACEAVIQSVGNATKSATTDACKTILAESLKQVPRDTGTLASTAWYHVESAFKVGSSTLSSNRFVGYVGYAGSERERFAIGARLAKGPEESKGYLNTDPQYTTKFKQFQGKHHPGGRDRQARKRGGKWSPVTGIAGHGVGNAVNPKNGLPASAYAAIVHEDLDMPHPNGGKAKFLEDPVRDFAATKFRRTLMHHWKYAIEWSTWNQPSGLYRTHQTVPMYSETSLITRGTTPWKGDSL